MERRFPSLVLIFFKSPKAIERVELDELSLKDATGLFERAYARCALTKTKGDNAKAAALAKVSKHTLRKRIGKLKLRGEFPATTSNHYYRFSYVIPKEQFIPFGGTLKDLEDRYVLQVLIQTGADRTKALAILKSNRRDPYPAAVISRLKKREGLEMLTIAMKQEPFHIEGTLAQVRNHFIVQTAQRHELDLEATRLALGIKKPGTFRALLYTQKLGRTSHRLKPRKKNPIPA